MKITQPLKKPSPTTAWIPHNSQETKTKLLIKTACSFHGAFCWRCVSRSYPPPPPLPPHRLFTIQKQESRRLARNVHETTLKYLRKKNYRTHDGGIKTAPFHVLRRSGVPGVLIEVGYCTNKTEAERLAVDAYRASIARGIANGILIYTGKM